MGKWDEAWKVLRGDECAVLCYRWDKPWKVFDGNEGAFFKILFDEREGGMAEDCRCEEEAEMGEELAGEMAGMTIGVNEDEVAKAQETMHQIRVLKAQREEEMEVVKAERRRLKFVLSEYDYD